MCHLRTHSSAPSAGAIPFVGTGPTADTAHTAPRAEATPLGTRIAHHLARAVVLHRTRVSFPTGVVSFSFDDFPRSAATRGADILGDRGIRGSFFACAAYAGQTVDGIRQFDTDDIARLHAAGHEIGCHTAGHRRLPGLSAADVAEQFDRNAAFLDAAGAAPPQILAYPYGDVDLRLKSRTAPRFRACRGVWAGLNHGTIDRALLRCVCLEPHVLAARPAQAWIAEAMEARAWLIFLTHEVEPDHGPYGISPRALEDIADYATGSGARILPIGEALDLGTG